MAAATADLRIEFRPRGRAVTYAEELGLNEFHTESKAASDALGILYHQRAQEESKVRHLKAQIEGRTAIVTSETECETFASQAALERAIKRALANDEELRRMSDKLRAHHDKLGEVEAEIKSNERSHQTSTARVNQLAGYFAYLAASKEAQTADKLIGQIP